MIFMVLFGISLILLGIIFLTKGIFSIAITSISVVFLCLSIYPTITLIGRNNTYEQYVARKELISREMSVLCTDNYYIKRDFLEKVDKFNLDVTSKRCRYNAFKNCFCFYDDHWSSFEPIEISKDYYLIK